MTNNAAIQKLSGIKQTCRNNDMSFIPGEVEKIQVYIIEMEKNFKDLRLENIKLIKERVRLKKELSIYRI